jgi:deubiquitinase DESI2
MSFDHTNNRREEESPLLRTGTSSVQQGLVEEEEKQGTEVYVHVYDLVYDVNQYLYPLGLGIYHSSVEVHGKEYAFGGHAYNDSGVFSSSTPGCPPSAMFAQQQGSKGNGIRHRERIHIGFTRQSEREVRETIQLMGEESFRGNQYHLLQMNCNTFTSELVYRLTGKNVPGWINRLAAIAVSLHCLLPPNLVPPLLQEQGRQAAQHTLQHNAS